MLAAAYFGGVHGAPDIRLQRSLDGGDSWTEVQLPLGNHNFSAFASDGTRQITFAAASAFTTNLGTIEATPPGLWTTRDYFSE